MPVIFGNKPAGAAGSKPSFGKSFGKSSGSKHAPVQATDETQDAAPTTSSVPSETQASKPAFAAKQQAPAEQTQTSKPSGFLMRGSAAKEALNEAEARAQAAAEASGRLMNFFLSKDGNDEATITFLDGDLLDDGRIDMPMWWQHKVSHAGRWSTFACIAANEPCPFCDAGDSPTLVGALTIINHTPHTIQRGPNQGKVLTDRRQLFVATRQTIKLLQKMANKRGGLRYHTYDVSRSDKKSPRVGDLFQWSEAHDYDTLANHFADQLKEDENFLSPANYEEEIDYKTGAQLAELGITGTTPVGGAAAGQSLQNQL